MDHSNRNATGAWKEKVLKLMNERGINQLQLAKDSGISESSLSR